MNKKNLTILFTFLLIFSSLMLGYYFSLRFFYIKQNGGEKIIVINKENEKISIPYIWKFDLKKDFIDYKKDKNGDIKINEIKENTIKKIYNKDLEKKENLYDYFHIQKIKKTYPTRLDLMGKYNFIELLSSFSIAPYYDVSKNTLYVFSHSSGKFINPGEDFYKLELGDEMDLIDEDLDIVNKFVVTNREIFYKKKFNDEMFLSYENKIVLVSCYPLNSTKKRLVLVLTKIN